MTVLTDLKALSLSQNAKTVVAAKGADLAALLLLAQQHTIELQAVLKQIIAHHPSGGGDASNYAALGAVLAQLAQLRIQKTRLRLGNWTCGVIRSAQIYAALSTTYAD